MSLMVIVSLNNVVVGPAHFLLLLHRCENFTGAYTLGNMDLNNSQ